MLQVEPSRCWTGTERDPPWFECRVAGVDAAPRVAGVGWHNGRLSVHRAGGRNASSLFHHVYLWPAKAHVAMTWLSIMGWLVDLLTDQNLSAEKARLVASLDVLRVRFGHPSIFLEPVLDDSKDGNVGLAEAFFRMLREAQGASWMAPDSCTMAAPSESVEREGKTGAEATDGQSKSPRAGSKRRNRRREAKEATKAEETDGMGPAVPDTAGHTEAEQAQTSDHVAGREDQDPDDKSKES